MENQQITNQSSVLPITVDSSGKVEIDWKKLALFFQEFEKQDTKEEISFPPTLTPPQRKEVHDLAERFNLEHTSRGGGNDRRIVVANKSLGKSKVSSEAKQKKNEKKWEKIPHGMSEIIPGFMFLGSARDSRDWTQIEKNNIQYVLNCAKEWSNPFPETLTYHNASLVDVENEKATDCFKDAFEFIGKD